MKDKLLIGFYLTADEATITITLMFLVHLKSKISF